MVTFICSQCGQERTGQRQRCYECTKYRLTDADKQRVREQMQSQWAAVSSESKNAMARSMRQAVKHPFDLGAFTRGKPSPKALPIGSTRVLKGEKDGRIQVKCTDGKWRYRSRVVWEQAHGPLKSSTIIHHINGDPADERLENLQAVTRAEHAVLHADPDRMRAAQLLGVEVRKRNDNYKRPHGKNRPI